MHVPRIETRTLDETVEALDLGQTPADIVFLSFSDSDLNALARAYGVFPEPKPTLRIASLAALRHPFSVDLYLERVCARAKLVVVRVLVCAIRESGKPSGPLVSVVGACLVGMLVNSLVIDTLHWRQFWFLWALAWGVADVAARDELPRQLRANAVW